MIKKDDISSFSYCPLCRSELELARVNGVQRKRCPDCEFVDWHNPAPAAGAVIVENGKLLLVKRADNVRTGDWCVPAGFVEWGESPAECAVRELREETGYIVKLGDLFNVYSGDDDPRTNALLILYFGEIVGGEPRAGDDAGELHFFGKDEIPDNIAFAAHVQTINDLNRLYPGMLK